MKIFAVIFTDTMVGIQINNNIVEKGSGGTSRQNQEEPTGRIRYLRIPSLRPLGTQALNRRHTEQWLVEEKSGLGSVPLRQTPHSLQPAPSSQLFRTSRKNQVP